MNISNVINQIEQALSLLRLRQNSSNPWFFKTIALYEEALLSPTDKNLKKLLGLSRAYLETASDWSQDFFIETDRTEQLLKNYLNLL